MISSWPIYSSISSHSIQRVKHWSVGYASHVSRVSKGFVHCQAKDDDLVDGWRCKDPVVRPVNLLSSTNVEYGNIFEDGYGQIQSQLFVQG